ncbi:SunS family peptide S-glycosyltransferase [Priestia megaterium]
MHLNELNILLKEQYQNSQLLNDLGLIINDYNNLKINKSIQKLDDIVNNYIKINYPKVSCAVLTYNEEKNIKRCIDSLEKQVDEIIIIDSGSRDNTLPIIKSNFPNVKIYLEDWKKDFSLQRNKAIQYCTTEWIYFIDADNYIANSEENSIKRIAKLVSYLQISGVISPYIIEHDNSFSIDTRKMFRKKDNIYFYGKVHEEPLYKDLGSPQNIVANINVHHDGYDSKKVNQEKKTIRNLELEKEMLEKEKENPKWFYFYARSLYFLKQDKEVIKSNLLHALSLYEKWKDKRYYVNVISYLCKLSYETQDFKSLKQFTILLDKCTHNCSDVDYYNGLILLYSLQNKLNNFSYILETNESKYKSEEYYSLVNNSHDHIQTLRIQTALMLGDYEKALKLTNKIQTLEIRNETLEKISTISQHVNKIV